MSNEEVTTKELSDDELFSLLDNADIVQRFGETLSAFSVEDGDITLEFESEKSENISFNFIDNYTITQNGNKITIEAHTGHEETCVFHMFKKVPFSG
jgi:hypothetical protein